MKLIGDFKKKIINPRNIVMIAMAMTSFVLAAWIMKTLSVKYTFSISPSVGNHLFKRVQCPDSIPRWMFIEVIPPQDDPLIPHPESMRLIKHVACYPGEVVIRKGLEYWCKTKAEQLLKLGKVKLKANNGTPLKPFLYDPNIPKAQYLVKENEIFAIGSPIEDSYDSRYIGPIKTENIVSCLEPVL